MAAAEALNSGVLYTERRDFYPEPQKVHRLWGGLNPFNTIIEKLKVYSVPDPDFRTFEYKGSQHNPSMAVAAGVSMPATVGTAIDSITVAVTGAYPTLGQLVDIYGSTGTYYGQAIVTTVGSSTSISVKPIYMPSGAASAATGTNTTFEVVGFASEEGMTAPIAWSQELTMAYNSCAILRTPVELTGTLLEMGLRGERERTRLRYEKGLEHQQLRENALLFSRRKSAASVYTEGPSHLAGGGGKQIRTTHGFIPTIVDNASSTNIHTLVTANASWADWVTIQKKVWKYSNAGMTKMMGCGDTLWAYLHQLADNPGSSSKMQITQNTQLSGKMGFPVFSCISGFGLLELFRVPSLTITGNGRYAGYGLIFDPEEIGKAQYRTPSYRTAIKTDDGYDGVKDEYFADEGLFINLPERHHIIKAV